MLINNIYNDLKEDFLGVKLQLSENKWYWDWQVWKVIKNRLKNIKQFAYCLKDKITGN